ncbi:MAG: DNA mismatch repair protein MutS [Rickettsiales bacterium]|nr:DNA mismatch repair protein MutS [Rickettsiales bacterium]
MQQYLDMKSENEDAALLFRLGDFYEAFFNDARIVSSALNLVLTHRGVDERGSDIPMCGIPWHASENYFARLVSSGISVAIAEQMETPEQARNAGHKQIERKIVRVITPGTITDENLLNPKKSNFLVAVVNSNFIGCDISTGELFYGVSANVFDDLTRIAPAEIIYPSHLAETPEMMRIRGAFITSPVYEKLYQRADINKIVSDFFGNNFAMCADDSAICLLAGYLFNTGRGMVPVFQTPYRYGDGNGLRIDASSWKSLEIDAPFNNDGVCLLDILDKTRTASGARKLRAMLRELSSDIGEIRRRQNHISHLILNNDVFSSLSGVLETLPDAGRGVPRLVSGRGMPRDLRVVSEFLRVLPKIKIVGQKLDSVLSDRFSEIKTFDDLSLELGRALNDNLPSFFRDGGIIRDGFDGGLDNMRLLASGAMETIAGLQSEYITTTGINTLKIKYNNILGYHIEVPSNRGSELLNPESGFIHRQTLANNMRFTTARLIELDNDVRGAADKARGIEEQIIQTLIKKITDISDELLAVVDLLSEADVWLSCADVARDNDWVRPQITDGNDFNVVGGRHPVIEWVLRKDANKFIPNDCNLTDKKIALITGPNMAGKSTYLRQNALIIVLAHLGGFVPAESAVIGVCDQLFSRVGASDNLAAGQSTFMVEMTETANILNRATEKSFIIFDEIGRGTATFDGMAIANAVLEFLDNMNVRTLFATHYHELTGLSFNSVQNLNVSVAQHNDEIIFLHKIAIGPASRSYGIHVAALAGMPKSVVENAERILADLENNNCATQKTKNIATHKIPNENSGDVFIIRQKKETNNDQLKLF